MLEFYYLQRMYTGVYRVQYSPFLSFIDSSYNFCTISKTKEKLATTHVLVTGTCASNNNVHST